VPTDAIRMLMRTLCEYELNLTAFLVLVKCNKVVRRGDLWGVVGSMR
jgi:hypothetical protein